MNLLGSNKETAQNKLILLYIIDKLNFPVSNLHITKLILEFRLMNYFMLQQYLNELSEAKLLEVEAVEGKTLYRMNDAGRKALDYFTNLILPGIKARIDEAFNEIRRSIKDETLVTADYIPESENKFIVACKVGEDGFPLLEMKITVGTKSDARLVCENWKKHPQEIYSEIVESLTKKRE